MLRPYRVLMIFLIVVTLFGAASESKAQNEITVTTRYAAQLRGGPGTNFPSLGVVPTDTTLPAIARSADKQWVRVNFNGTLGWVAIRLVTVNGDLNALPLDNSLSVATQSAVAPTQPTVQPRVALGGTRVVKEGGYSFKPPIGYNVDVQRTMVFMYDKGRTVIMALAGATSNPQGATAEQLIDAFLSAIFKEGSGTYGKGSPQPIMIGGIQGSAYDITGTLFSAPVQGQAVIAMPSTQQFLFGLGIANQGQDKERWANEGSRVFSALIGSVTFVTSGAPKGSPQSACVISTDKSFGYTKGNPIKVGGGDFGGPPRERAYLDNLRGPNGENISYNRVGSVGSGNTILDEYVVTITGSGKTVTLYIDEYAYVEPKAPVGFTCATAFPLTRP